MKDKKYFLYMFLVGIVLMAVPMFFWFKKKPETETETQTETDNVSEVVEETETTVKDGNEESNITEE